MGEGMEATRVPHARTEAGLDRDPVMYMREAHPRERPYGMYARIYLGA